MARRTGAEIGCKEGGPKPTVAPPTAAAVDGSSVGSRDGIRLYTVLSKDSSAK
jgi:hypothetical protein